MALRQLKGLPRYLARGRVARSLSLATQLRQDALPPIEPFVKRHIGPLEKDVTEMLKVIGVQSMDELIDKTVPKSIRLKQALELDKPMSEYELIEQIKELAELNKVTRSYVGQGYYNCIVPPVIARNLLENPGWITQYTPYQPELSQGRLESLMNYQTMVVDMTGLDIANASLLDEPTAAAEAMGLCYKHARMKKHTFFIDQNCYAQSIAVVQTRAKFLGIKVVVGNFCDLKLTEDSDICGALIQYPNNEGRVIDYTTFIESANKVNIPVAMCTDLLSLTMLKSPGELGASIALGSCQRLGVPIGCGGPHAAFFSVKEDLKKLLPGRIVGSTWDNDGKPTFRLALQTREQHIRRDKATSNICTSQALLANMSAMYAVYHGPDGLKGIAKRIHRAACLFAQGLSRCGHVVPNDIYFDTVKVTLSDKVNAEDVKRRAGEKNVDFYHYEDGISFGVAFDEAIRSCDINDLFYVFGCDVCVDDIADSTSSCIEGTEYERTSLYLQHPVFNSYHSETEIVRYMKRLENRDLSLVHSMTPLGSCTMKLNPTTSLLPLSLPQFNSLHPYAPENHTQGYRKMLSELEQHLCEITGYDKFSFQPNSGAQGEYAGLCTILAYLRDHGQTHRNICLIPESAHGTNPASAMMAGLKVVVVPTKEGVVSTDDFRAKIEEHHENLAAVMITYPSTSGVFEDSITEICDMIHHYGGQVYVDGANMNAQVGLCRPGDYGGDVSHLNLHKTFCIPHGGGGPGMGPIGVKSHLAPYLPTHPLTGPKSGKSFGTVSAAEWGSASILPISWAYIKLMGLQGLTRASQVAILNANYMSAQLKEHYNILFRGKNGFNAHEFILDTRVFKATAGVDSTDITKRLQDYGFHAPTLSWPVTNTLMIEPTESESRAELDRYCDALISIRNEIHEIEEGKYDKKSNVLKNAPHTMSVVTGSHWAHPYSREKAAFPASWLTPINKRWPCSARANDVHGDKNVAATLYQKLVSLKK